VNALESVVEDMLEKVRRQAGAYSIDSIVVLARVAHRTRPAASRKLDLSTADESSIIDLSDTSFTFDPIKSLPSVSVVAAPEPLQKFAPSRALQRFAEDLEAQAHILSERLDGITTVLVAPEASFLDRSRPTTSSLFHLTQATPVPPDDITGMGEVSLLPVSPSPTLGALQTPLRLLHAPEPPIGVRSEDSPPQWIQRRLDLLRGYVVADPGDLPSTSKFLKDACKSLETGLPEDRILHAQRVNADKLCAYRNAADPDRTHPNVMTVHVPFILGDLREGSANAASLDPEVAHSPDSVTESPAIGFVTRSANRVSPMSSSKRGGSASPEVRSPLTPKSPVFTDLSGLLAPTPHVRVSRGGTTPPSTTRYSSIKELSPPPGVPDLSPSFTSAIDHTLFGRAPRTYAFLFLDPTIKVGDSSTIESTMAALDTYSRACFPSPVPPEWSPLLLPSTISPTVSHSFTPNARKREEHAQALVDLQDYLNGLTAHRGACLLADPERYTVDDLHPNLFPYFSTSSGSEDAQKYRDLCLQFCLLLSIIENF
jgi:hypothetical protein